MNIKRTPKIVPKQLKYKQTLITLIIYVPYTPAN